MKQKQYLSQCLLLCLLVTVFVGYMHSATAADGPKSGGWAVLGLRLGMTNDEVRASVGSVCKPGAARCRFQLDNADGSAKCIVGFNASGKVSEVLCKQINGKRYPAYPTSKALYKSFVEKYGEPAASNDAVYPRYCWGACNIFPGKETGTRMTIELRGDRGNKSAEFPVGNVDYSLTEDCANRCY
jgi:hypothetical protein